MLRYSSRRVVSLVPIWLLITFMAFLVAVLAPGDPARVILERQTGERPTQAEVAQLRRELHLDEPVPQQYARWVGQAVRGDLGTSYRGDPVLRTIGTASARRCGWRSRPCSSPSWSPSRWAPCLRCSADR